MKVLIVCLFGLLAAVSAADHRCRGPTVFESHLTEYLPNFNISIPLAKFSYDGENRRTRTIEVITRGNSKTALDIIYLQRCKTMFVFNMDTKKCNRTKVDVPWKDFTIPDGTQYLGDAYVGSAGVPLGGLLVQTWYGNSTEQGGFSYVVTFTRHGCLPVSAVSWGPKIGAATASFYNVILGIDNPNVFRPPKECYEQGQVMVEDMEYIEQPISSQYLTRPKSLFTLLRESKKL